MTVTTIVLLLICLVILSFIGFFAIKINKQRQEFKELSYKLEEGYKLQENLKEQQKKIEQQLVEDRFTVDGLASRKKELNSDIAAQIENVERLKTSYDQTEEEFKKKYMMERQQWINERQDEYVKMQEEFVEQFRDTNRKKMDAAKELDNKLEELRSAANAAVEVAKRHAEEENFVEFHSLQVGSQALNDIRRLEEIVPSISQEAGEAIAKVIWKVYYEKPYTDLVGRAVGSGRHTGIYRITNINTQMCYVGQAVDIGDRWRQHIKRALGAEQRTQNKLYPAMYKEGLENWTFEIVEECSADKLNEREDYWQDFYKAKEYGYSIK